MEYKTSGLPASIWTDKHEKRAKNHPKEKTVYE
jgi:hypothetical protein